VPFFDEHLGEVSNSVSGSGVVVSRYAAAGDVVTGTFGA